MPTHNDETLHDRYTREHLTHLARLATMTPDQIAAMELDLHNALAEVGRLRSQLPSQEGEAVEVVAWANPADLIQDGYSHSFGVSSEEYAGREPLMTVAQHQRIMAAATHPSDQVSGSSKQIAWKRRDEVMGCKRFMTQKCYDAQSPQMKGNYEPFYCAHCKADQVAPDSRVVPVELLEVCVKRWSILANEFITGSPSYEEEQLQIGKLRALLEVK